MYMLLSEKKYSSYSRPITSQWIKTSRIGAKPLVEM